MSYLAQIGWKSGPRSIGDILDGAITLYRHNFARLLGITAVVYVPFGIFQLVFTYLFFSQMPGQLGGPPGDFTVFPFAGEIVVGVAGLILVGGVAMAVAQAALAWAVSEIYLGRQVGTGAAYRYVLARFWPLMLTMGLAALVTGLPLTPGLAMMPFGVTELVFLGVGFVLVLLGLIPSLVFVVLFAFVVPVVVVEGDLYVAAMARSRQLVAGHFWRVVGIFLILSLLVGAISYALSGPANIAAFVLTEIEAMPWAVAQTGAQAVGAVATLLLTPVQLIGTILVYYDLRIRKEGFDLDQMAAESEAIG